MVVVNTDGGTRGNPGPAAWGVVVRSTATGMVELSGFLDRATNNEAEYEALINALRYLIDRKTITQVEIRSDSQLMVRQINGEYSVNQESLMPFWVTALSLFEELKLMAADVRLVHVPREQNKEADALCNAEMDRRGAKFEKRETVAK